MNWLSFFIGTTAGMIALLVILAVLFFWADRTSSTRNTKLAQDAKDYQDKLLEHWEKNHTMLESQRYVLMAIAAAIRGDKEGVK